jgi:hypothetical protein
MMMRKNERTQPGCLQPAGLLDARNSNEPRLTPGPLM